MKKVICVSVLMIFVFFVVACDNCYDLYEKELGIRLERNVEKNEEGLPENIEGYWIRANGNTCDVLKVGNNEVCTGVYPGTWDRGGNITEVIVHENDVYELKLFYPSVVMFEGEEAMPETECTIYFYSADSFENNLTLKNTSGQEYNYVFAGKEEKQYMEKCEEMLKKSSTIQYESKEEKFPELPIRSELLDVDVSVFIAKVGRCSGPDEAAQYNAEKIYELKNTNDYNWYMFDGASGFMGEKNGKVAFYGQGGFINSSIPIANFLPVECLNIEPKIYESIDYVGDNAYVWKIENGYLIIRCFTVENSEFYKKNISSIAYVKDISDVSFIE